MSDRRATRRSRGRPWRRIRAAFLAADPLHRLCAECLKQGRTEPTAIVDHIVPVAIAPEREFDLSNLQGLCRRHSDEKTARENRGER